MSLLLELCSRQDCARQDCAGVLGALGIWPAGPGAASVLKSAVVYGTSRLEQILLKSLHRMPSQANAINEDLLAVQTQLSH